MSNKFYVDSSEENGAIFTNEQQRAVSVTFTAKGRWNTGSKINYGPEGKVGTRNKNAAYPNNRLYALLAVNSNNEVVGEGASISLTLEANERVSFKVNDTHYPNNRGQLTVDWQINAAAARQLPAADGINDEPEQVEVHYPERYMGGRALVIPDPSSGAMFNAALALGTRFTYSEETVEEVTDGVWVIGGYSSINCTVIEAPDGLIVYDTGDYAEEGAMFREVIEENISKEPIVAIIYSHSHNALGAGEMASDPCSAMVIGHKELEEEVQARLENGGVSSLIPEIGPALSARAAIQFSNYLPESGPDAALSKPTSYDESTAFLEVTCVPKNGETICVAGLDLQFFVDHQSDDYSVTVWIPSKQAVLNNFFWPGTPNLYTLRGGAYRDPQEWRDGLKLIRDLEPEHLINLHSRAVSGKENVQRKLLDYMDLISLTYDQSLRGIMHGLSPDELRYYVYKPAHLRRELNNKEFYGETIWYTSAPFYHALGWYPKDATTLYKLPPGMEAQRLVPLMGGKEKVVEAALRAEEDEEYAWAAQLINYVCVLYPEDREARQIKARILRELGQRSVSTIGRAFALTEARELEGLEQVPQLKFPDADLIAERPTTYLNYHRIRIDPKKAEDQECMLAFDFGDSSKAGLHVRHGVAEYVPDVETHYRSPEIELKMSGETWARLHLNQSTLAEEIENGNVEVVKGDEEEAIKIFDLFDDFGKLAATGMRRGLLRAKELLTCMAAMG